MNSQDKARVRCMMAKCLNRLGDYQRMFTLKTKKKQFNFLSILGAINEARLALLENPEYVPALKQLATAHFKLNQIEQARIEISRALSLDRS